MAFLEIVGHIASFSGLTGVTLKSLATSKYKPEVKAYIAMLETRRVLYAEIDLEVKAGVLASMEEILDTTRDLLQTCHTDQDLKNALQGLIRTMQREMDNIRAYDDKTPQGQYKIFLSLQKCRTGVGRTLAVLCSALNIDPGSTELKELIVNVATVRPRT